MRRTELSCSTASRHTPVSRGTYESGLMKMMTIGLGKQYGAYIAHSKGDDAMPERLYKIGCEVIKHGKVVMGRGSAGKCF